MVASDAYSILHEPPSVATYRHLRTSAGLSDRLPEAAARGLAGGLFAVQILFEGAPIAMARVVGDGGSTFQVVDVAVLPAHQGKGLGKRLMAEVMGYIDQHVPDSAYVSLIADGEAQRLYAQYGFAPTAPASVGMSLKHPRLGG
jgi:ribosomal protein S18 acetylase RimI-like enzyme